MTAGCLACPRNRNVNTAEGSGRGLLRAGGRAFEQLIARDFQQFTVFDADRASLHLIGATAFRVVHQRVGTMNQIGGELSRDAPPLAHRAKSQTDHADVDAHGPVHEPAVVTRPVVRADRSLEPVVDINSFKWYNDTYGHATGDRIIERVARILSDQIRSEDFLALERSGESRDLHARFGAAREVGNQKAEFVAAEARVQIA